MNEIEENLKKIDKLRAGLLRMMIQINKIGYETQKVKTYTREMENYLKNTISNYPPTIWTIRKKRSRSI